MEPTNTATATATPEPTETPQPSPTPTATPVTFDVAVAADRVGIRRGPSENYVVIARSDTGEQWQVIGRNEAGDWLQLCCFEDGQVGVDAGYTAEWRFRPCSPTAHSRPSTPGDCWISIHYLFTPAHITAMNSLARRHLELSSL